MNKKTSIFSVFVLSILALLTFCNSGVNSEDSKDAQDKKEIKPGDLFIYKNYNDLKSGKFGCRVLVQRELENPPFFLNEYGIGTHPLVPPFGREFFEA